MQFFKQKYQINQSVCLTTQSDFSARVGLGSSSAVTVATFLALSYLFGQNLSRRTIFDLSYQVTLAIQKVGSGFDIAAATYGGILYYVTGGQVIKPLKAELPSLIIGYSGIKADTPSLIKKVQADYQKNPQKVKKIFQDISCLVDLGKEMLLKKNYPRFGWLMNQNHLLLQKLGVSSPKLDFLVKTALQSGAYGAKLSGAGGGDCMIALCPQAKSQAVAEAIQKAGGELIAVLPNAEGVILEDR